VGTFARATSFQGEKSFVGELGVPGSDQKWSLMDDDIKGINLVSVKIQDTDQMQ
jgi:hypothetical protein